ncbi:MAG: MFS transporter [Armatimonadetes bacterium]|nr:MFS transporter [Armatimonadota bacterium]
MSETLVGTLRGLRGNARGAIITEPLWGIPFNLFAPYASVYMLALGLRDSQVGFVTSVAMAGQVAMALLAGVIIDKMGRKRATLVFDILAWTIPCLLWACARDIRWFIAAGLVNSLRKVPDISWNCLLVEDTNPEDLMHIYALSFIAGQMAVFFAPVAGVLITHFTLVPSVRGMYVLACVMMTTKFIVLNGMVSETRQGAVRMEETRGRSVASLLREYRGVLRQIRSAPHTLFTIALMVVVSIVTMVQGTFWSIIVTERIHIPAGHIALYPFARSLIMLAFLFLVVPRLRGVCFGRPMMLAFAGYAVSQLVLINVPERGYGWLLLSTVLEAGCYSVVATQVERLAVVNVDARERARIVAMAHLTVIACTTPFGWVAGILSQSNRALPFVLNAALLAIGIWVVRRLRATEGPRAAAA